jgi:tRNA nucleotidyltransferase (CCA-adding enzyme)
MEETLIELFEKSPVLLEIKMILESVTSEAYLVGGSVRDVLYGDDPKDFDFAVGSTNYDDLSDAFKHAGWSIKETGKEFLVLMVTKLVNGERQEFEIALLRKDGMYEDGRRPEGVETGTLREDAFRRDFSINSLYFDIINRKIVDPTGKGLQDMRDRVLRFNGNAKERMQEDYLRMYRALRFLKKYNLTWSRGTERVFNRMFIENSQKVNPQRVLNELNKFVGRY